MSEGREQLIKFFFLMIQGSYNDCTSIQGSVARVDAGSQMRKIKLSGGEFAYFYDLKLRPISLAQVMPKTKIKNKPEDHINYSGNL